MAKQIEPILKPEDRQLKDKLAFLKRTPEERQSDVLKLAHYVVEHASTHPNDPDNPVNRFRREQSSNQFLYFYVNDNVHSLSTNRDYSPRVDLQNLKTANADEINQIYQHVCQHDFGAAYTNAVGLAAIDQFTQAGDHQAALLVLSARPDLNTENAVVEPLAKWLISESQKPQFLTDTLPQLTKTQDPRFPNTNLLYPFENDQVLSKYTPVEFSSPQTKIANDIFWLGAEIKDFNLMKSEKRDSDSYKPWLKTDHYLEEKVGRTIGLMVDRDTPNYGTEFMIKWRQEIKPTGPEDTASIEKLTFLCQSDWFAFLPNDTIRKTLVIDILIAASISELHNIAKNPGRNSEAKLKVIGQSLATAKHLSIPEISTTIDKTVENFGDQRPGLVDDLQQSISQTTQKINSQIESRRLEAERLAAEKLAQEQARLEAEAQQKATKELQLKKDTFHHLGNMSLEKLSEAAALNSTSENTHDSSLAQAVLKKYQNIIETSESTYTKLKGMFGFRQLVPDYDYIQVNLQSQLRDLQKTDNFKNGEDNALILEAALKQAISKTIEITSSHK